MDFSVQGNIRMKTKSNIQKGVKIWKSEVTMITLDACHITLSPTSKGRSSSVGLCPAHTILFSSPLIRRVIFFINLLASIVSPLEQSEATI